MRKIYISFWLRAAVAVAGAVVAAACQRPEPSPAPSREKVTLTAVAEQTRTSLGSDLSVRWSADDQFLLFGDQAAGTMERFVLMDGAGTASASFEGYMPAGENFFAAYPEAYCVSAESGRLEMWLPQTQAYVPGTFAEEANPMVAWATGEFSQLNFRNVCGIMELRITGEGTLASVAMSSNQAMSGQIFVPMWTEGATEVAASELGVQMTGINEPLSATEPLSLYFVVPAGAYGELSVVMTDASGAVVVKTATDIVMIERGAITPVEGLVFEETEAETVSMAMTVDAAKSNWKATYVNYQLEGTMEVAGFKACSMLTEQLEEYLASGYDLKTILLSFAQDVDPFEADGSAQIGWLTGAETSQSFLAGAVVGEELVGEVARLDYTTPAMPVDPALGLDVQWQVGDTYASYAATVTGGATRYYSLLGMGPIWTDLSDSDALKQVMSIDPYGKELTGTTLEEQFDDLVPETDYVFFLLLEGPNGVSQLYRYAFTTQMLQPGEDTAAYRQFLGTWTLSYTDLLGVGMETITATVEEDVVGRTYRVSGLMGSFATSYGVDDTIQAYFEEGQIVFRSATGTAAPGPSYTSVLFYVLGESPQQINGNARYVGTCADDTVTFASDQPGLNGYAFIGLMMSDGTEIMVHASGAYGDVTWTRQTASNPGRSAVVEEFVRLSPVNPVWK